MPADPQGALAGPEICSAGSREGLLVASIGELFEADDGALLTSFARTGDADLSDRRAKLWISTRG